MDSEEKESHDDHWLRSRWFWAFAGSLTLAGLVLVALSDRENPEKEDSVAAKGGDVQASLTLARPVEVVPDGFVSSRSCVECHPNEHRSWKASYHRTMTQVVNDETAPDAIRDQTVVVEGEQYRFDQDGDRFYVTLADPLVGGQLRRRQIPLMTGSHHMHVFWYESDFKRTPGQLQIVYLKDEQRWVPRRSAFLRPPDMPKSLELGRWNQTCSKCHSTHPRQRLDRQTREWDTHVVEFGIACEACHGQGAKHAEYHAANDAKADTSQAANSDPIVNPHSESQQISADICGRCHSISIPNFAALDEDEYLQHGNPFQPGDLLADTPFMQIIQASPEHRDSELFRRWSKQEDLLGSFWPDGMPRISGREYNGLIESPCFQHGKMTCLSCHTMHPSEDQSLDAWRDDQLKPGMRGDKACLQCHQEFADRIAEHTHHAADSNGSRCMNCHMPYTTYGLLKTIRSHQISSPSANDIVAAGRPSACALCHLDRSFDWISKRLHEWYDQPEVTVEPGSEAETTSTAVLHFLRGDAGQRAVQAAAFAWPPAREASGTDWMEPFLLFGLNDPYDAIRVISARALKTLPDRRSENVDALASPQQRQAVFNDAIRELDTNVRLQPRREVLIDEEGAFDFLRARQLIEQRNHRRIYLRE